MTLRPPIPAEDLSQTPKPGRDWKKVGWILLVAWSVTVTVALGWLLYDGTVQTHRVNAVMLRDIGAAFESVSRSIVSMLALHDPAYGNASVVYVSAAEVLVTQSQTLTGPASPMDALGLTSRNLECVSERFQYLLSGGGNATYLNQSSPVGQFFGESGLLFHDVGAILTRIAPDGSDPLTQLGPTGQRAVQSGISQLDMLSYTFTLGHGIPACSP